MQVLRPEAALTNAAGGGTVSHLAPELFLRGSELTTAVDGKCCL